MLRTHGALEDVIADDPYDDARWSVLEDWLLEQDDPRAEILRADDPAVARGTLMTLLLGENAASLRAALYQLQWRGGFLCECYFAPQPAPQSPLFAELVRAPATALLRRLTIKGPATTELVHLADAPCAHSLRVLVLSTITCHAAPAIDCAVLARLPRLEHLVVEGHALAGAGTLPRLRRLEWQPPEQTDARAALESLHLPALEHVTVAGVPLTPRAIAR